MSIEIGQQGQYPTREVRRIPISPQVLVRPGQGGHGHAATGEVQSNGTRALASGRRMTSEVSSVFASGSEFDTDWDQRLAAAAAGASRSRSETRAGASAAYDGDRWATTTTTESRQSRRTTPVPKGSLAERWKMLNDEFQDRFVVDSSGVDAGKASGRRNVSRISNFERFDNVKQIFAEGNGKRSVVIDGREGGSGTNETKVFQYERSTKETGFVDSKPTRKELDSSSKHSRSVLSTEEKSRKKEIRGVKTSKTERVENGFENRVHGKRAGLFKRGEKVRKKDKGVKSVRKVEEKTAEFVDELLDDAFSSCLPTKRRSISMINLSNSAHASPYRRSATNEEFLTSRRTRNDETENEEIRNEEIRNKEIRNEEIRRNAVNGRYQENSRQDWRYIKSSLDLDGEAGRQTGRHFAGGQGKQGSKWRSSREENIENVRSFHTKSDRRLDAVMTGSSHGLESGYRRAQSHRNGRELTHVIRPIPGSGIYTRKLSGGSSRRRGSGSSDQWIPYSHSEGYVSDTALSSRSTVKQLARYEGEQRGWYQPSESRTKESRRIGHTSDDSNLSSTFKIRQKYWSHDDLIADTRTSSQETWVRKSRPPTLTKGLITRIFHGSSAETNQSSPTNTVYLDSFSCRSSELGSATPHSRQSWSQFQSENEFGHATRVPVRDDLNPPSSRPSRSIAAGETHLLEILPYESLSSVRSSQQSASPAPRNSRFFAESSSRISDHGAGPPSPLTFSNLPIVVSDVLSPTDSVRPSTSASIYSDPGSAGTTLPSANVRMTRDQVLNFYVFNNNGQQKPGKQNQVECEEITKSIYLGGEDDLRRSMMLTSRETQTTDGGQPMRTQVLDVQRSNRYEHEQPRRISGHKETVHYITHQREIEKIPEKVDKRRVESSSTQTDLEVPVAPRSRQDEQRTVHVSVEPKEMVDEDEMKETSSFDEFWTKTQYPYETVEILKTSEPAPVKVSVVRHSAEVTETEPIEEEEDIVETTVVEEKEEKIQMEIREEVEFSMLRKKGTSSLVLESDGGRVSVEPWWIPDKYEAVVDRRKIKTTKSEHKLNDEDYSFKQERHLVKEPGTTSSSGTSRQTPVQVQRKDHRSSKIASPGDGQNLSSTFVSQRTFTQPPKSNRFTRNPKHGDQSSRFYSGHSGGHFDESGSRSMISERYSQISPELPGRYLWNGRKRYAAGKTANAERFGSSYEPNNVSFGRKSDEMVLREMRSLKSGGSGGGGGGGNGGGGSGGGGGGTWSIGSVETGALPMGYEGGVVYASQSAPVSETRLLRDEDGGVVKVTDRKHTMTKTVAYPDSSSLVGGSSSVREGHAGVVSLEEVLGVSPELMAESGLSSSTEILNSLGSGYEDPGPQESGNTRNVAAAAGGSFMHFETVATSL